MTNETDLRECSAQIELIRQLITQPETFDLDKVLIELENKKKLLMTFKPRSYITILKDLESGRIKHPGDWVKPPKRIEEPKIDKKAIALEKARKAKAEPKELEIAKLKILLAEKEAEAEVVEEPIEDIE